VVALRVEPAQRGVGDPSLVVGLVASALLTVLGLTVTLQRESA